MPPTDFDGVLRLLFGDPRLTKDLLLGFVNGSLDEWLDWSTFKQVAADHVDESLQRSENDMIWQVSTWQGESLYVYLMLEFQSQRDWKMSLRMANYVGQFYRGLSTRDEIRQQKMLPPVLPVVLYTGEKAWNAAQDVGALIQSAPPGWEGHELRMKYKLVDMWRSPKLDRALRNLADAVFRLQRVESPEVCQQEVDCLREWLRGEEWADLRRALTTLIMEVVLPLRLPGLQIPEVQDLDQLDGWMETNMKPWSESIRAEARAEALAEGEAKGEAKGLAEGEAKGQVRILVSQARRKFGESAASALAALLGTVKSEAVLDEVGGWLLTCHSGDALLAKIREI